MQMLVVSDLHYALKQLDWVLAVAGEFDVVVMAGDHLDIASAVEPDVQIAVVLEYVRRIAAKTNVIVCSGNHDLNDQNEHDERSAEWFTGVEIPDAYFDGDALTTDTEFVTVCRWWDGPLTRADVGRQFERDAALVGDRRWIWVYHAPPDASPTSWTGRRHYGDDALSEWIAQYQPAIVICGHVHQSPFVDQGSWFDHIGATFVVNSGRQRGPVPTFTEIDTATGRAEWRSLEGGDTTTIATAAAN